MQLPFLGGFDLYHVKIAILSVVIEDGKPSGSTVLEYSTADSLILLIGIYGSGCNRRNVTVSQQNLNPPAFARGALPNDKCPCAPHSGLTISDTLIVENRGFSNGLIVKSEIM